MKKICLNLLLVLVLALGGCPSGDNDKPQATQDTATEQAAPDSGAKGDTAITQPAGDAASVSPAEATPDAPDSAPVLPETAPPLEAPGIPAGTQEDANMTAPSESLPQVFTAEALNATDQANATVQTPELPLVVTAIVETEPEPVTGIVLPELLPGETAKSRNFPPTPQVAKPGDAVSTVFGVPQPQPAQPAPTPEFGVTPPPPTPEPVPATPHVAEKPAVPPPPAPEPKPAATPADLGLDLGAEAPAKKEPAPSPEPPKKPEPPKAVEPEKPVLAQPTQDLPEISLQQAPKPAEPVKIRDVEVHPLNADTPINPLVDQAISTFKDFASYWVDKVSGSYIHNRNNIEVANEGGKFVARYTDIDKKSLELWIKEKPYDHTPFVGLMRYQEFSYESVGDTPEQALAGKFDVARRLRITEIFRFANGKWIE